MGANLGADQEVETWLVSNPSLPLLVDAGTTPHKKARFFMCALAMPIFTPYIIQNNRNDYIQILTHTKLSGTI